MAKEYAKKFYNSSLWKKTRDYIYNRESGVCQKCKGEFGAGEIVHHIIHLNSNNINDPNITLNEENLILVCRECHARIHEGLPALEENLGFDYDGNLIEVRK